LPKTQQKSFLRSSASLSLLTLVSRVLGLVREMTKAAFLGTSALSDAFSVAFQIPNFLRRLFAEGSVSVAFIPVFQGYLIEESESETREFLNAIFTFLTVTVSLAVGLGILAAPLVIRLCFRVEAFDETVLLTRIMFPFLAFISLAALFQGVLNSLKVFTPSALAPILLNLVTIVATYALTPFMANPARAMAVGILAGGFLEAAIQLPWILRRGYRFRFCTLRRAFTDPGVRRVLALIGPTIIGMAAYQLNDLVSSYLATRSGVGVLSSLQYSLRLQELILGVFAVSIGTALLPDLGENAKKGDWRQYNDKLITAMDLIALITIPVTFISLSQGNNLIRLLFEGRSFTEESAQLTMAAFRFHMPGLFFIALNRILAPAFYALGDSKSPAMAGIFSFAVNIALAVALAPGMRGGGIALALSVSSAVNTVFLLLFLRRNSRIEVGRALRSATVYTLRLALFSAIALVPVFLLGPHIQAAFAGHGRVVSYGVPFALNALLFGAVGVGLLVLTRDKQARKLLGLIKK
jgi:putative peptidoglycan lipid II flippase